jgi:hypothetical protein
METGEAERRIKRSRFEPSSQLFGSVCQNGKTSCPDARTLVLSWRSDLDACKGVRLPAVAILPSSGYSGEIADVGEKILRAHQVLYHGTGGVGLSLGALR